MWTIWQENSLSNYIDKVIYFNYKSEIKRRKNLNAIEASFVVTDYYDKLELYYLFKRVDDDGGYTPLECEKLAP